MNNSHFSHFSVGSADLLSLIRRSSLHMMDINSLSLVFKLVCEIFLHKPPTPLSVFRYAGLFISVFSVLCFAYKLYKIPFSIFSMVFMVLSCLFVVMLCFVLFFI